MIAMSARLPLSDAQRQVFAALILLDRVATQPGAFHAALMEARDDAFLEPTFRFLQQEDLVEVGDDDHYRPTERGRRAYAGLLRRRQSYLAHFEIFARVDLAAGTFAEPDDPYDNPRWSDLRVAVAEYKGIDPYRIVFLAMLSDEAFFRERDWKFDLALGSSLFRELEEIIASQITIAELGYRTENDEEIFGDSVLEDVILQGARRNREHLERERALQPGFLPEPDREVPAAGANGGSADKREEADESYDPFRALAFYESSALYVEPLWLADFW
jgi:hypothetical protein